MFRSELKPSKRRKRNIETVAVDGLSIRAAAAGTDVGISEVRGACWFVARAAFVSCWDGPSFDDLRELAAPVFVAFVALLMIRQSTSGPSLSTRLSAQHPATPALGLLSASAKSTRKVSAASTIRIVAFPSQHRKGSTRQPSRPPLAVVAGAAAPNMRSRKVKRPGARKRRHARSGPAAL